MEEELIVEGPKYDFMLKFADEAEMMTAFAPFTHIEETRVLDENGEPTLDENGDPVVELADPILLKATQDYAIDVVGLIYKETGNMLTDDAGNEYPEMAPIDGWHVNLRLMGDKRREEVEAIAATYEVTPAPATPHRVWA